MNHRVIAVYPGTFDPITLGHEDIVCRACELFDEVVIGVAQAHHKKTLFTLQERLAMASESARQWSRVRVASFEGLVTHFVRGLGGRVMVRGLRSAGDFEYERQLADMNARLAPEVESVFLTPGMAHQCVSSTLVREIALLGGDASPFVAPHVWQRLLAKRASQG